LAISGISYTFIAKYNTINAMKQHLSVHKCAILLIFAIFFSAVTASAQYEAYLHKPYAETIDSLDACLKRFEDAQLSIDDETAEWNKVKTFAVNLN
jgi:hypothetical protein